MIALNERREQARQVGYHYYKGWSSNTV
jgi:hypothetical protein